MATRPDSDARGKGCHRGNEPYEGEKKRANEMNCGPLLVSGPFDWNLAVGEIRPTSSVLKECTSRSQKSLYKYY